MEQILHVRFEVKKEVSRSFIIHIPQQNYHLWFIYIGKVCWVGVKMYKPFP